jgi:hypothetical protein
MKSMPNKFLCHLDFRGYRGGGYLEISAPGAFTAFGFSRAEEKPELLPLTRQNALFQDH